MLRIHYSPTPHTTYEEITINEKDIQEFMLINHKTYTKKGIFKSFFKFYYVRINGERFQIPESSFKFLKEELKGKYQSSHTTETEYKGFTERKATDWYYKMV